SYEFVQTVFVNELVALENRTLRAELDDTGLTTVQGDLAVLTLQRQADAFGDDETDDWSKDQQEAQDVGDVVQRHHEVRCHQVRRRSGPHDTVEDDGCNADGCTSRCVSRTIQNVVFTIVAGDTAFDPWPGEHTHDQDTHRNH